MIKNPILLVIEKMIFTLFFFVSFFHFYSKEILGSFATTGKVFEGKKFRSFENEFGWNFFANRPPSGISHLKALTTNYSHCNVWAVTTTIFNTSISVKKYLKLPMNYCLIVVADLQTPLGQYENLPKNKVLYMDVPLQKKLSKHVPFVNMIPWNSFFRKNIGYIIAIVSNPLAIWDMDDDNVISTLSDFISFIEKKNTFITFFKATGIDKVINPFPLFLNLSNFEYSWPRGLPIENIKRSNVFTEKSKTLKNPLIIQSLANNDPDVDAIFRLTKPLNITFRKNRALVLSYNQYSPLNAQSCIYFNHSFITMFLPMTVHGRVSDIWRGYIAESLLHKYIDGEIIITSPLVNQNRNSHNYLADYMSEKNLYEQSNEFVKALDEFGKKISSTNYSIYSSMEMTYKFLYDRGYVEAKDVINVVTWIDLIQDSTKY